MWSGASVWSGAGVWSGDWTSRSPVAPGGAVASNRGVKPPLPPSPTADPRDLDRPDDRFGPAGELEAGRRAVADPHGLRFPPADRHRRDVPFVPTDRLVVERLLDLAGVGPGSVAYDLGCGDGRIVLAAAGRGARAVGVDVDLERIKDCHAAARRAGYVGPLAGPDGSPGATRPAEGASGVGGASGASGASGGSVRFVRASLFDVDLSSATAVALYLLPGVNVRLRPKLLAEVPAGGRVVSNGFEVGDWPADETVSYRSRTLYRWTVPAAVGGAWRGVVGAGPGDANADADADAAAAAGADWRFSLDLRQRYQSVGGAAKAGGRSAVVAAGRLDGDRLAFTLRVPPGRTPPRPGPWRLAGRVVPASPGHAGPLLRGDATLDDGPPVPWTAWRE